MNEYVYCWDAPEIYVDNDGQLPTIAIGAIVGGVIGGVGSVISDVAKGEKINLKKAGKNFVKGAAAGAIIGTGVGAVSALSTAGASFRAGSDIVASIKNKEMTISPFNRYISSAIGGAAFYHSWKISKGATVLGGTV